MASVGSIVGGAFRLFVERPGAILTWAAVNTLWSAASGMALSFWLTGTASLANPGIYMQTASAQGFWGVFLAAYAGALLFTVVLTNAVFRSVLRPEQSSFASFRLGMDEVRTAGLIVGTVIIGFLGLFIVQLLMMLVVSFLGLVGGETVAGVLALILILALFGAMIWLWVRLSLIYPLTLYRREFSIDAGWELGRSRFWKLFGAYLVVFLVVMILGIAVAWAMLGDYLAAIAAARNDPVQMQIAMAEYAQRQLEMSLPARIVQMIIGGLVGAAGMTLVAGATASATRELLIDRGEDEPDTQDWSEAEI